MLQTKAVRHGAMPAIIRYSIWHNITEDLHLQQHRRQSCRS